MVFGRILYALSDGANTYPMFNDDIYVDDDPIFFYPDIYAPASVPSQQTRNAINDVFAGHANNTVALFDGLVGNGGDGSRGYIYLSK
jgi:hypothetical protein